MPRDRRMISRSISTSRKVNRLQTDQARLLFTWMILHADDEGRMEGNPETIKMAVIPGLSWTLEDIKSYLSDLTQNNLIKYYQTSEEFYIQINKWDAFQTFHGIHKSPSKIPPMTPISVKNGDDTQKLPEVKLSEVKLSKEKITTTTQPLVQSKKRTDGKLTSIQELIEAYKTVKGFQDIPDWNKINFARFTKDAKNILSFVKSDVVVAVKGLKRIARQLNGKNLSWNLSTVVRMFPDWLIEKEREDYDDDSDDD